MRIFILSFLSIFFIFSFNFGNGCRTYINVDIVENSLMYVKGQLEECCEHCEMIEACLAFVWKDEEGGTCWLKSSAGHTISNNGAITGIPSFSKVNSSKAKDLEDTVAKFIKSGNIEPSEGYHSENEGCSSSMPNKDILGHDIKFKKGKLRDCCGFCKTTSNCKAYSWKHGTCYLKSATKPVIERSHVYTGILEKESLFHGRMTFQRN